MLQFLVYLAEFIAFREDDIYLSIHVERSYIYDS
jgi:hypothetical protein